MPATYALGQNFPNPFNPSTVIRYQLPADGRVTLKVYNLLGQVIATLVDGVETAGFKSVRFDAGSLASGIYIYRLTTESFTDVKKMMIVR